MAIQKKPRRNHQIRASQVRVIDEAGENLGTMPLSQALQKADERGLDLIEVAPNAQPPVARIMDYGKYMFKLEKKEREAKKKQKSEEIKGVRLRLRTSGHDLAFKAKQVDKFLKKGYKVRIELVLRGREKALQTLAEQKVELFLQNIEESYKIEQELKKSPRGMTLTISHG